jgi:hypothetical protein
MTRQLVNAYGLGTTLNPLVHSEEVLGNKAFFRRLSIRSGEDVIPVPVLSGNSFRGAWRDLMAIHLVETLGIKRLSATSFVTFFSGGSLRDGERALADALYANFPTLRLFGFSMGGRMFASRIGVDFAVPLTEETHHYVKDAYPDLTFSDPLISINAITGMTMMTRKDDQSKAPLIDLELVGKSELGDVDERADPTQMIYNVEYIVPGTQLVHGFRTVYPVSDLELGALIKVLELASQRTFGGLGSKGFGRMEWTYTLSLRPSLDQPASEPLTLKLGQTVDIPPELERYKTQYQEHLAELRPTIENDQLLTPIIQFAEEENG